jgi:hypothetical protein
VLLWKELTRYNFHKQFQYQIPKDPEPVAWRLGAKGGNRVQAVADAHGSKSGDSAAPWFERERMKQRWDIAGFWA